MTITVFPKANELVSGILSTLLVAAESSVRWLKPKAGGAVIPLDVAEVDFDVLGTRFMTYLVQIWVGPPPKE